jgi:SAM-dependent methyltransferase
MTRPTPATTDDRRDHWNGRYATVGAESVSWYEPRPRLSLAMLELAGLDSHHSVLDVGGGASPLAGELVARGITDVSVLDLSDEALSIARRSIADPAVVEWITADITAWTPDRTWNLWHDRAGFHFLTEPSQREAYRSALHRALEPDGAICVATFADDGPEQCSGLPVVRYSPDALMAEVGDGLHEIASGRALHTTPSGGVQPFSWIVARR